MNNFKINHQNVITALSSFIILLVLASCSGTESSDIALAASEDQSQPVIDQAYVVGNESSENLQKQTESELNSMETVLDPEDIEANLEIENDAAENSLNSESDNSSIQQITKTPAATGAEVEPVDANFELPPEEPQIGYLAPDFVLNSISGEEIRLSDYRGQKVMINYWVTWCIPCMEEMIPIKNLYLNNNPTGFSVVSINGIEQDEINKVQEVLAEFNLPFPVLLDEGDAFFKQYRVFSLPTSYLVDENGVIQEILIGSRSEADLNALIENFIAGNL